MERIPPQNEEAEKSVLGSILLDKDALIEVSGWLRPLHFYEDRHSTIYENVLELFEEGLPVDLVTVSDKLKKKKGNVEKEWREKHTEIDGTVDEAVITEVVSAMTGIPLKRMEAEEAKRLLNLEKELSKTVIGQDNAVNAVAKAVRRSRAGLQNPNRPSASFIFIGPSGVGKTLLSEPHELTPFLKVEDGKLTYA